MAARLTVQHLVDNQDHDRLVRFDVDGQGSIDVDAPVAKYWPEFAANGKEGVLVRHIMSHTAGLPGWEKPITVETLLDWVEACSLLAAQAPWWTPGDGSGYHAISQGYLAAELVRRVSGKTLGTFFAEHVAGPVGADFHIGTNQAQDHRVIPVIPPPSGAIDAQLQELDGIAKRALGNPTMRAESSSTIPLARPTQFFASNATVTIVCFSCPFGTALGGAWRGRPCRCRMLAAVGGVAGVVL